MSAAAPQLQAQLPEIGAGLAAQLQDLSSHPTPERAERCAANLQGAAREVLRFREQLLREAD